MRLVILAQHPDQTMREIQHILGIAGFIGPQLRARFRDFDVRKIDRVAGPKFRFRYV